MSTYVCVGMKQSCDDAVVDVSLSDELLRRKEKERLPKHVGGLAATE